MKEKDFIDRVKKAKSDSKSPEKLKLYRLANAFIDYLKSPYSENAIKFIDRWIISKYDIDTNVPPQELHKLFLETARYYVEHGRLEEAEDTLVAIAGTQNLHVAEEIEEQVNIIKMKRALEKGEVDGEAQKSLNEIAQGGSGATHPGNFTAYDMATTYFSEMPVQHLNVDIFPPNMRTSKSS